MIHTLIQTITAGGASSLDIPSPLSKRVEAKLLCDFCSVHSVGQILLVGKHQKESIPKFILVQHSLEFLTSLRHTFSVVTVNDEDNTLGVLEVVAPERTNLVLSTDIPNCEGDVLVFNSLDVKSNCGDSGDNFTKLQLVENGTAKSRQKSHAQTKKNSILNYELSE